MITEEEQERDYQIHCAAINAADDELKHLDKLMFEVNSRADYDNGFTRGFKEGAAWADEHPKSQWISVEERLPENSDRCFVASGRPGCLDVAYYDKFKEVWEGVTGPYDLLGVAYWMPVPKFEEE